MKENIEKTIQILKDLKNNSAERDESIRDLQMKHWYGKLPVGKLSDALDLLVSTLDYYDTDPEAANEDPMYFGEEKLQKLLDEYIELFENELKDNTNIQNL